jgi:hypothetical protein
LKEIGKGCFHQSGVKEIEIPKECENLSGSSLDGLKTVKVAIGHNSLVFKDQFLINMTKKVLIRYFGNKSKVSINNRITIISDGCFRKCESLNEIIFESKSQLKEIGESAFEKSGLLSSIRIPNSVEKLGDSCFYWCKSLREVIFESESQLKEIGKYCFCGTGVKVIEIPKECENLSGLSLYGLKTVKVAKGHNSLVVKDEFLINMKKNVLIRYFGNNIQSFH